MFLKHPTIISAHDGNNISTESTRHPKPIRIENDMTRIKKEHTKRKMKRKRKRREIKTENKGDGKRKESEIPRYRHEIIDGNVGPTVLLILLFLCVVLNCLCGPEEAISKHPSFTTLFTFLCHQRNKRSSTTYTALKKKKKEEN